MERCACKNSLIEKNTDASDKKSLIRHDPWHMRKELIKRAVLLAIFYGFAQLFGCREWVAALLQGASATPVERVGCITYLLLYGSFIFLVPMLAIAVLLLTVWEAFSRMMIRCTKQKQCMPSGDIQTFE